MTEPIATEPAARRPSTLKVRPEHHAAVQQLAIVMSARLGRRMTQPEAVYLATRYALANADAVAEYQRSNP